MQMSRSELETNFVNLRSYIKDIKTMSLEIRDSQQRQYEKVIILQQDQKHMQKEIENHRKNTRWGIGIIMPAITAIFLFTVNYFSQK